MLEEQESGLPRHIEIKIKAIYSSLKPAERKAADYFTKEPALIKELTISKLASSAGCSEATICRFAKKIGFETYSELKDEIVNSEGSQIVSVAKSYSKNDSVFDVLQRTFDMGGSSYSAIDMKQFEEAFNALKKAETVLCVGVGDAAIVASAIYNKLIRIGRRCYMASDTDTMNILCCSLLKKDDVVICISHSGKTKNVVNVATNARKKGVKVIALTNFPMSQLAKRADYSLFTASFAESVNGEVISKRIAELCIIESLFISLILSDKEYTRAMDVSNESVSYNKYD